ncbi:hypothetical protein [Microbacterium sp.]|uniref:hypothetical protein n=1 Tax=Microbacterium sp. TaxID=51671 RepID=UPI003F95184D
MNLAQGWTNIWNNLVPSGLQTVLAVVGVAIIAFSLLGWLWSKRKAQGGNGVASGFPVMAMVLGCLCAGPNVILPAVLAALGGLIDIIAALIEWIGGTLA